jgi:hypothetical protein
LAPAARILIQQIPKQLERADAEKQMKRVKFMNEQATTAAKTVGGVMITSGLAGSSALSFWGCFNTIQLITMQAYTGSQLPSNAASLFQTLDDFFRGGPLNPGSLVQKAFSTDVTKPVTTRLLGIDPS